uniref:Lectin putative n=1 Tax=Albugo laibachii Nc14 TaxID=890382 RepID=F0X0P7_9STRA|nr:lectin putative [Albugo laibachii Nc14]|eukprot:CCA27341.1 lectin putative [Albugo laibachii Nc14]
MNSFGMRVLVLLVMSLHWKPAGSSRIDDMSFQPPFKNVDYYGDREINDTWHFGGSCTVKKNFVRLNSALSTQRGWIWSEKKVGRNTISMVATIRLSGHGDGKENEGIAFWFSDKDGNKYSYLRNYGFAEEYKGFGVIIRQPKESSLGDPKDISIQYNDGTGKVHDFHAQSVNGCNAPVWYDEKSADFKPAFSQTRLKIQIDGPHVSVQIDANIQSQWKPCQEFTLPFESDWLASSTFSITSSQGPSNYNSDIISVHSFTDFNDDGIRIIDTQAVVQGMSKTYDGWLNSPSCGVDCTIAVLRKSVMNLHVNVEHRLMDLKESTTHMVDKLRQQEMNNEFKVSNLERELHSLINTKLEKSHGDIKSDITARINEEWKKNSALGDHGWKGAFFITVVGIVAFAFLLFQKYRALMKSHLM